jgi:hypothetical protein
MTPPLMIPKKTIVASLACIAWLVLGGCSTPKLTTQLAWRECDEPQQEWPTRPFGLLHSVDGFPIYGLNQFPPDPYEVRAIIQATTAAAARSDAAERERAVVKLAREIGGHAALTAKSSGPSAPVQETSYLVISFKTNALANAVDRINVYLALTAGATNQAGGAGSEELDAHRAELEKLQETLLARPPSHRSLGPAPTNNTSTSK